MNSSLFIEVSDLRFSFTGGTSKLAKYAKYFIAKFIVINNKHDTLDIRLVITHCGFYFRQNKTLEAVAPILDCRGD